MRRAFGAFLNNDYPDFNDNPDFIIFFEDGYLLAEGPSIVDKHLYKKIIKSG